MYVGKEAATGAATSFVGAQAGKIIGPALSKLGNSIGGWFKNSFQAYAKESIQTVIINGKPITTSIEVGIKATKIYVAKALGGTVANVAKGGKNVVYHGLDASGTVKYVGITERAAGVRFGEHLNSGTAKSLLDFEIVPGATGLTRTQARVWEQTLINQYGLGKNGGQLLNKVNSIAPKYWWQYGIK